MDIGERGGEGETYGESNMETYITLCRIDNQGEFVLCLRKFIQGLCIKLKDKRMRREMGGRFKREGLYVY